MAPDRGEWDVDAEGNLTPPSSGELKPDTDEFGRDDPAVLERERRRREREMRRKKGKPKKEKSGHHGRLPQAAKAQARVRARARSRAAADRRAPRGHRFRRRCAEPPPVPPQPRLARRRAGCGRAATGPQDGEVRSPPLRGSGHRLAWGSCSSGSWSPSSSPSPATARAASPSRWTSPRGRARATSPRSSTRPGWSRARACSSGGSPWPASPTRSRPTATRSPRG